MDINDIDDGQGEVGGVEYTPFSRPVEPTAPAKPSIPAQPATPAASQPAPIPDAIPTPVSQSAPQAQPSPQPTAGADPLPAWSEAPAASAHPPVDMPSIGSAIKPIGINLLVAVVLIAIMMFLDDQSGVYGAISVIAGFAIVLLPVTAVVSIVVYIVRRVRARG